MPTRVLTHVSCCAHKHNIHTPFSILWLSADSYSTLSLNAILNLLTVATHQPTESHVFSVTTNGIKNRRCVIQNTWHSLRISWLIDILFQLSLYLPLNLQTSMVIKQTHFAPKLYFLVKYNS
jgi:hypothetical protein